MPSIFEKTKEALKKRNAERGISPLERWVQQWLPLAHIYDYETEYQVDYFFLDIAFPNIKLGIELDGYEFHKDKKERDENRDEFLSGKGWTIIRIPSKECWNPRILAFHLKEIHQMLFPNQPIPFGIAELLGEQPRHKEILVRKEHVTGDVHMVLETNERMSKFERIL
jgi:very-short-patch-repair endonuclease